MKSNRFVQKMVLNTHRVDQLGYNHQGWVYVCDTTHRGEVFMKMIQQTAKSATKNDMFYFGDFWILINICVSEQKRVSLTFIFFWLLSMDSRSLASFEF